MAGLVKGYKYSERRAQRQIENKVFAFDGAEPYSATLRLWSPDAREVERLLLLKGIGSFEDQKVKNKLNPREKKELSDRITIKIVSSPCVFLQGNRGQRACGGNDTMKHEERNGCHGRFEREMPPRNRLNVGAPGSVCS